MDRRFCSDDDSLHEIGEEAGSKRRVKGEKFMPRSGFELSRYFISNEIAPFDEKSEKPKDIQTGHE